MISCCCSLAGTKACDSCPMGPSNQMVGVPPVNPIVPIVPHFIDYERLAEEIVKKLKGDK